MTPTPTHKALTIDGEWVEGWFDYSDEEYPIMGYPKGTDSIMYEPVLPHTVCRATGLTDKNGVHIWEGDELALEDMTFYVEWFDGGFHLGRNDSQTKSPISQDRTRKFTLTGKNINDRTNEK